MKIKTVFVFSLFCSVLFYSIKIYSGCPPTQSVISETTFSCSNTLVDKTWKIFWQDGNTSTKGNSATGQCSGIFTTTQCPPRFEEPRSFPTSINGQPSEEWAETAYNRKYNGGCMNNGYNTETVTHSCRIFGGGCNAQADYTQYPTTGCATGFVNSGGYCTRSDAFINQCNRFGGYESETCNCAPTCGADGSCSPIVIDVSGNGFSLTNSANGVQFDIDNDGSNETLAWTKIDSDDAWLALDRNGDGVISGGRELFGNATPQPPPPDNEELNGFLALTEFDKIYNGGNEDGKINRQDMIFANLRLWRDTNHNGISDEGELFTLDDLDVRAIDLDYRQSRRTDEHGNQFKYRAKVRDRQNASVGRWAWDVFLRLQP